MEEYPEPPRKGRRDCIGSWQARYRDPSGKQCAKNFKKKGDADDFLDAVRTSVRRRTYHDPKRGEITLKAWWDIWWKIESQKGRTTTRNRKLSIWRAHVSPKWGHSRLIDLEYMELQGWLTSEVKGHETQTKVKQLLNGLLKDAVRDNKRLPYNPAADLEVTAARPVKHPDDLKPPTEAQYDLIHAALPAYYQVIFRDFAQESGMRPGEYAGLRMCWIDEEEAVAHIREILVLDGGRLRRQLAPKTAAGFRTVPLTPRAMSAVNFMKQLWKPQTTCSPVGDGYDLHVEELVLRGPRGGALNRNNLSRPWNRATEQAGVQRKVVNPETGRTELWPTIYAYKDYVATKLHAEGVPEKDTQAFLGHERGGRVTWVYTHESEGARENVRAALTGERGLRVVS
ncbi:tyrosine-type recombinase/integrase [Streptomyces abikoensis]|uniref:tyrosine-type recombinase/integrase n=1 Tax=Streptomyces abikoensis TaxID=97398 RepID=UPI001E2CB04A|nr:site-specific integrase [Streptomyces abikoensis]